MRQWEEKMNKLLMTTAIAVASMAFGSAAFAQQTADGTSLLDRILADADGVALSLVNAAENYAAIDGTVSVTLDPQTLVDSALDGLAIDGIANVDGLDGLDVNGLIEELAYTTSTGGDTLAVTFYDPTAAIDGLAGLVQATDITVSNVTSTAIGALNTGTIGTVTAGLAEGLNDSIGAVSLELGSIATDSESIAGSASASLATYGSTGPIVLANLALNNTDTLTNLTEVNVSGLVNLDTISATSIGALNTGNIASDISANLISPLIN